MDIKKDNHETIEEEIQCLADRIREYRRSLNQDGIWLFLATLGCWSVPGPRLRIFALMATLFIFFEQLKRLFPEEKPFKELIKAVEVKIDSSTQGDEYKKARLYDLSQVDNEAHKLSWKTLKYHKTFIVTWAFFIVSLAYFLAPPPS